jgi:hypothetical protein
MRFRSFIIPDTPLTTQSQGLQFQIKYFLKTNKLINKILK